MRRSDREITEIKDILGILDRCAVMRVAMKDASGELYIVPLNFGCEYKDEKLTLYFHSALSGRKLDIIRENPEVAFEMDIDNGIKGGEKPCDYTCFYESIIGNGRAEVITDIKEKIKGLMLLMKNTAKKDFEFDEKMAESVATVKIAVTKFSCKKH